jgi:predicted MFS family arabinose efflux permease
VAPLSATQIVSWGSLIYAFTLFVEPMSREFGWSKAALSAAYSLGLVASGLGAVPVGHLIDRGYGRFVLTGGSLAAALLLALWSQVSGYPAFIAVWIGIGFAMSATLYEPGFAVLTRILGPLARRGVTVMTLVGGFASTVFLPLTHGLIDAFGWRGALLGLAGLNAACALVHFTVAPAERDRSQQAGGTEPDWPDGARRVLREPAFWGFVAVVVLHSALLSGFIVHLIPILVERGFTLDSAVAAFALFGPAQVGARLLMAATERRLSLRAVGIAITVLLAAAFLLLPAAPPGSVLIAAFCMLFGAANGTMTLLRAVLPPELFGRADYGVVQGMIAMPATFARAAGPFILAAIWSWTGATGPVLAFGFGLALASALVFALAVAPSKVRAGGANLQPPRRRAAER